MESYFHYYISPPCISLTQKIVFVKIQEVISSLTCLKNLYLPNVCFYTTLQ